MVLGVGVVDLGGVGLVVAWVDGLWVVESTTKPQIQKPTSASTPNYSNAAKKTTSSHSWNSLPALPLFQYFRSLFCFVVVFVVLGVGRRSSHPSTNHYHSLPT